MSSENHPRNVCIIGNIASGKSTLANRLAKTFENSCYIPEVFEKNPFLPLSLIDPARWAFTNLIHYFWDYARIYADLTQNHGYQFHFIDAGIWTNSLIYGRYLSGEGVITPDEYSFYQALSEIILHMFPCPEPVAFIALNASPETCWARIQQRGWAFQTSTVELPYLRKLARYHEEMKQIINGKGIPILEISSEEVDYANSDNWRELLTRVERLLQTHHPTHA